MIFTFYGTRQARGRDYVIPIEHSSELLGRFQKMGRSAWRMAELIKLIFSQTKKTQTIGLITTYQGLPIFQNFSE